MQAKGRLQCWNADGQRAWWKLPRDVGKGLLRFANLAKEEGLVEGWQTAGFECPNKRGLCAGKGQAATLEQQRLTARGPWRGLCAGKRQARRLCAGKGQAATLEEQQRLTARGLGGSCRGAF